MCRHGLRLHKGVKQSKAVHTTAKMCFFSFVHIPSIKEAQINRTYKLAVDEVPSFISTLPSSLRKRHKDDLLASDSAVWLTYCHQFDCTLQRLLFILNLRKVSTTTPGMRTLLLSTSSLARTLWWVMHLVWYKRLKIIILIRNGEKHQDGSCGFHRLSWRPLWSLSWLQHHLILRNHLLGFHWILQSHVLQALLK